MDVPSGRRVRSRDFLDLGEFTRTVIPGLHPVGGHGHTTREEDHDHIHSQQDSADHHRSHSATETRTVTQRRTPRRGVTEREACMQGDWRCRRQTRTGRGGDCKVHATSQDSGPGRHQASPRATSSHVAFWGQGRGLLPHFLKKKKKFSSQFLCACWSSTACGWQLPPTPPGQPPDATCDTISRSVCLSVSLSLSLSHTHTRSMG